MKDVQEVRDLARHIRIETLKMLTGLGFGHYGGSMSVVETLAVLYGDVMRIDPKNQTGRNVIISCCPKAMLVRRCMPRWH